MVEQESKNSERPYCKICGRKMHKNDTRNGRQRWRCPNKCKHSSYTEKKYISKTKRQAINFLYNLISTLDNKTGYEITQTNENLAKTDIKCNEDKKVEVEVIRINKNKEGVNENNNIKNIRIPARSYIVYIEKDKNAIKMICLRYIDKAEFNRGTNEFSVAITYRNN